MQKQLCRPRLEALEANNHREEIAEDDDDEYQDDQEDDGIIATVGYGNKWEEKAQARRRLMGSASKRGGAGKLGSGFPIWSLKKEEQDTSRNLLLSSRSCLILQRLPTLRHGDRGARRAATALLLSPHGSAALYQDPKTGIPCATKEAFEKIGASLTVVKPREQILPNQGRTTLKEA